MRIVTNCKNDLFWLSFCLSIIKASGAMLGHCFSPLHIESITEATSQVLDIREASLKRPAAI